jgi:hypothetical protein
MSKNEIKYKREKVCGFEANSEAIFAMAIAPPQACGDAAWRVVDWSTVLM